MARDISAGDAINAIMRLYEKTVFLLKRKHPNDHGAVIAASMKMKDLINLVGAEITNMGKLHMNEMNEAIARLSQSQVDTLANIHRVQRVACFGAIIKRVSLALEAIEKRQQQPAIRPRVVKRVDEQVSSYIVMLAKMAKTDGARDKMAEMFVGLVAFGTMDSYEFLSKSASIMNLSMDDGTSARNLSTHISEVRRLGLVDSTIEMCFPGKPFLLSPSRLSVLLGLHLDRESRIDTLLGTRTVNPEFYSRLCLATTNYILQIYGRLKEISKHRNSRLGTVSRSSDHNALEILSKIDKLAANSQTEKALSTMLKRAKSKDARAFASKEIESKRLIERADEGNQIASEMFSQSRKRKRLDTVADIRDHLSRKKRRWGLVLYVKEEPDVEIPKVVVAPKPVTYSCNSITMEDARCLSELSPLLIPHKFTVRF